MEFAADGAVFEFLHCYWLLQYVRMIYNIKPEAVLVQRFGLAARKTNTEL